METAYEFSLKNIRSINPSMHFNGGDFDQWQLLAREKLRELLGMHRFQKTDPAVQIMYETVMDGTREIRFTFESEKGYRIPCHLLLPEGIDRPPVMICLQGHSMGMHVSLGRTAYPDEAPASPDDDFCLRAVREGFAAIALEQRNFGEKGGTAQGPDCYCESMNALLAGRTTIGERVWDVMCLISVLESHFSHLMDIHSICLMGLSGGGTATAYTAALEDRIILAMPSCAVCTYADSIAAMYHCSCNFVPGIANYFDMGDIVAMACPKYYVQVSGTEDNIFPITGAIKMFEQGRRLRCQRRRRQMCTRTRQRRTPFLCRRCLACCS